MNDTVVVFQKERATSCQIDRTMFGLAAGDLCAKASHRAWTADRLRDFRFFVR